MQFSAKHGGRQPPARNTAQARARACNAQQHPPAGDRGGTPRLPATTAGHRRQRPPGSQRPNRPQTPGQDRCGI
eukprot:11208398-Lingulodinium_polyedra.AAC.1